MASKLVSDDVWERIRVLLPERPVRAAGGRPPLGDREVLTGVLFVLKTGIPWEDLPEEMGCGCGMTCVRRLKQWHRAGLWSKIQEILQSNVRHAERYNWDRAREHDLRSFKPQFDGGQEFELAGEDLNSAMGE